MSDKIKELLESDKYKEIDCPCIVSEKHIEALFRMINSSFTSGMDQRKMDMCKKIKKDIDKKRISLY